MPLTDKTGHEYSAVMTEVQVPVYRDGKTQMVPKYKYGDITAGENGRCGEQRACGTAGAQQEGKSICCIRIQIVLTMNLIIFREYLYCLMTKGRILLGIHLSPTVLGKYGLPFVLNTIPEMLVNTGNPALQLLQNAAGINLSGYNGIYLAAPSGKLYYYAGLGSENYHGNTYEDLRKADNFDTFVDVPKAKGKWDSSSKRI